MPNWYLNRVDGEVTGQDRGWYVKPNYCLKGLLIKLRGQIKGRCFTGLRQNE